MLKEYKTLKIVPRPTDKNIVRFQQAYNIKQLKNRDLK